MAQTVEQPSVETPAAPSPKKQPRRTRVIVRKVGPWSVLKFSLLFYTCVMLVVLLALAILYSVLDAAGVLDSVGSLIASLRLGGECVEAAGRAEPVCTFQFDGGWLFSRALGLGLIGVGLWSFVNVFVAFLYNLISDVVGGIEVTLGEKR